MKTSNIINIVVITLMIATVFYMSKKEKEHELIENQIELITNSLFDLCKMDSIIIITIKSNTDNINLLAKNQGKITDNISLITQILSDQNR